MTIRSRTQAQLAADVAIGKRVRIARHLAEMSQQDLADQIGLTFQQVQKYENGTNRIGGSRLVQIASALKRDVGWFFTDTDPVATLDRRAGERDVVTTMLTEPHGLALAKAFADVPPAMRGTLVTVAQAFAPAPQGGA